MTTLSEVKEKADAAWAIIRSYPTSLPNASKDIWTNKPWRPRKSQCKVEVVTQEAVSLKTVEIETSWTGEAILTKSTTMELIEHLQYCLDNDREVVVEIDSGWDGEASDVSFVGDNAFKKTAFEYSEKLEIKLLEEFCVLAEAYVYLKDADKRAEEEAQRKEYERLKKKFG